MEKTEILPGFKEAILAQNINSIDGTGNHKAGETVRYSKIGEFYHYLNAQNAGLVRSKGNYILTLLFVFLSVSGFGQIPNLNNALNIAEGISDGANTEIVRYSDGRFEIQGDTIAVIKMLWDKLEKSTNENIDYELYVAHSVIFMNASPQWVADKNKKNYKALTDYLKKFGYKVSKRKK